MDELMQLALSLAAGVALGAIFFGGLWWTVRIAVASTRVAHWFLCSLAARIGIVLAGFHLAGNGDWKRLAACLCGFIGARLVATRLTAKSMPGEDNHAP